MTLIFLITATCTFNTVEAHASGDGLGSRSAPGPASSSSVPPLPFPSSSSSTISGLKAPLLPSTPQQPSAMWLLLPCPMSVIHRLNNGLSSLRASHRLPSSTSKRCKSLSLSSITLSTISTNKDPTMPAATKTLRPLSNLLSYSELILQHLMSPTFPNSGEGPNPLGGTLCMINSPTKSSPIGSDTGRGFPGEAAPSTTAATGAFPLSTLEVLGISSLSLGSLHQRVTLVETDFRFRGPANYRQM